ncbi:HAD family phosphatase [Niallia oryzisoli]|uniref:HAD family phosphatase n=1 Tax=Niallia oryzisoli TaxID=1737571 RepID=A0ABZ2CGY2_9BACI
MRFPSLVIFDMDGLMFDTEKLASEAWLLSAEHYGFQMDRTIIEQFVGMTNEDILNRMSEIYGKEAPVHEWRSYMRHSKSVLLEEHMYLPSFKKKGLESLLAFLKSKQVNTAVASSSEMAVINKYLTVTNTSDYIDFRVSGDEVVNGKPNPEVFLKACEKADVLPANALVLEDSPAGLRAAKSAGIPSFFIPDTVRETVELRGLVTDVMTDLEEVEKYLRSLSH